MSLFTNTSYDETSNQKILEAYPDISPDDPKKQTLHHRKPTSIGGALHESRNHAYVAQNEHRAWHTFFDNLPAQQIARLFQALYQIFSPGTPLSELQVSINNLWIHRDPRRVKRRHAWCILYEEQNSLLDSVERTNQLWLDPDYDLLIRKRYARKLFLISKDTTQIKKVPRIYISREENNSWKGLFGDLPVNEIIRKLRGYHEIFGDDVVRSQLQVSINQGWANSTRELIQNRIDWYTLFDKLSPDEIAIKCNSLGFESGYQITAGDEYYSKLYLTHEK